MIDATSVAEMILDDFTLSPPDIQRRSISVEGDIAVLILNGPWQVCSVIVYLIDV